LNLIDSMLELQRTVGNRAVNRVLARETKVKVAGGVETKVVRPAVTKLLEGTEIEFWREVTFELLDAKGGVKVKGSFDFVLRDPRTHKLVYRELKGDDLKSRTDNQKIYVPEFESQAGGRVRITSAKGNISFTPNRIEQISPANFQLIGKEHLGKFGAEIGEMATGQKVTNVYIGPEGMKVFYKQADADAYFKTKNITPPKQPAKPPVDDKPLKRPTPNPNQKHPLHDQPGSPRKPDKTPDTPGSYGDPLAGPPPNKTVKRPAHKPLPVDAKPPRVDQPATPPKAPDTPPPAPVDKPVTPAKPPPQPAQPPTAPAPISSSARLENAAKARAPRGAKVTNRTSTGRTRLGGPRGNQGASMGKAASPHRMAAGVLIQSVANWSADKTLNHAVATQMLELWPKVVQIRAQHPDDKMVFEVWLQEWDVPGDAGTGRMVHEINLYHGPTEQDIEQQIAQAGRLSAADSGWHLVGPFMGWIEPYESLSELKKQAENKQCFIATACYGSPNAPEVLVLRNFRDCLLEPHALGRGVMRAYYRASPAPAAAIARRPWLRDLVRRGLVAPAAAAALRALERAPLRGMPEEGLEPPTRGL
jgi:hypothetical protein